MIKYLYINLLPTMTKKQTTQKLKELLDILITGNPEQIRKAKKDINALCDKERKKFHTCSPVVLEYLPKFEQIKKVENQAAFASGISVFFFSLADKYFDELADFTLQVLQHQNGTVREAIRKTADWLYVSLSSRIHPFIHPQGKKLTEVQKSIQKKAEFQYLNFVHKIELLINQYNNESEDVQYIQELKPSVNKSLQLFWSRLTESRKYQKIIEKMRPIPAEIALRRKEIEREVKNLLKVARSGYTLDDIKDIIFNSHENSLTKIITIFDTGKKELEIERILNVVNDAWNYFPHKLLNGLSPAEKILEYKQLKKRQVIIN